jgi:hypothetical protein
MIIDDQHSDEDFVSFLVRNNLVEKIFNPEINDFDFIITEKSDIFFPELANKFYNEFQNEVFLLWQNGLLDIYFDDDGKPMVSVNQNSFDFEKTQYLALETIVVLKQVISALT